MQSHKRLYASVARDEKKSQQGSEISPELLEAFLRESNLRKLKNLPSTLPLCIGQHFLLHDKICARLLLMNGCECVLEDILFDEQEELPFAAYAGEPILLRYLPTRLLLRAVDAPWTLPRDQLPPLPEDVDRR